MGILYNLRRINEVCKEHVDNNFLPLPPKYITEYEMIRTQISTLFNDTVKLMESGDTDTISTLRQHCDEIKDTVSDTYHRVHDQLRDGDTSAMAVLYVYVNMLPGNAGNGIVNKEISAGVCQAARLRFPHTPCQNHGAHSIKSK